MKKWYLLNGIEYSTNFDFFLKEQIGVFSKGKIETKYFSRLEGREFLADKFTDDESVIREKIRTIHAKILHGEFGGGILID